MIQQRKKRNSSKINLTISFIFHGLLILVVFFFAAREGLVGKKLKQLAVTMVPKEKKPEPAKEKPAEPKTETAKTDQAPKMAVPQPKAETAAAPTACRGYRTRGRARRSEPSGVRIQRRRKGSRNHLRPQRDLQSAHRAHPPLALEPP